MREREREGERERGRERESVCVWVWVCGGVWVCGCVGVWVCVCVLPSANVLCLTQNMARMHIKVQQTLPDACLRSEAVRAKKKKQKPPIIRASSIEEAK